MARVMPHNMRFALMPAQRDPGLVCQPCQVEVVLIVRNEGQRTKYRIARESMPIVTPKASPNIGKSMDPICRWLNTGLPTFSTS